jgi:hypothetical protein
MPATMLNACSTFQPIMKRHVLRDAKGAGAVELAST